MVLGDNKTIKVVHMPTKVDPNAKITVGLLNEAEEVVPLGLLRRYMRLVVKAEGVSLVGGGLQDPDLRSFFSDEEILLLGRLSREIDAPDAPQE